MLSAVILPRARAFSIFLGMIRSQVQKAAKKRGVRNAYQLQKVTGLPIGQAYRLWDDDWVQINFKTLNTLCNTLRCRPNDILEFTPDPID